MVYNVTYTFLQWKYEGCFSPHEWHWYVHSNEIFMWNLYHIEDIGMVCYFYALKPIFTNFPFKGFLLLMNRSNLQIKYGFNLKQEYITFIAQMRFLSLMNELIMFLYFWFVHTSYITNSTLEWFYVYLHALNLFGISNVIVDWKYYHKFHIWKALLLDALMKNATVLLNSVKK